MLNFLASVQRQPPLHTKLFKNQPFYYIDIEQAFKAAHIAKIGESSIPLINED
jgi:hypothetical protein